MSETLLMHFESDEVKLLLRLLRRLERETRREALRLARSGADFDEIFALLRRAAQHG